MILEMGLILSEVVVTTVWLHCDYIPKQVTVVLMVHSQVTDWIKNNCNTRVTRYLKK